MSEIKKDLGIVTAYGFAKSKGYTGTVEEFAEFMAKIPDLFGPKVTTLNSIGLTDRIVEVEGIPAYLKNEMIADYADYGITETGWYVFARIESEKGSVVTDSTTVAGAAGSIVTVGNSYVDVAVKFEVAALSKKVVVTWSEGDTSSVVFKATDLAVNSLDYRVTFYVYDIAKYATWEYIFATDATFAADKYYWIKQEDGTYTAAEVTTGDAIPAYYTLVDETYTQVAGTFEEGVTYYTKSGTEYTAAEVTVGETIPAYYVHSKVTFAGMARNITYRCNTIIDCPVVFELPEIEDETHGCWFEIRFQHAGSYSSTLIVPEGVKVATEHTQPETAGINTVDLHYTALQDGIKIWRFLNTHSSIPA